MKNKVSNIMFIIISIVLVVGPIPVFLIYYNYIKNNLIFLILIEIASIIVLCYLFKKKDISKLIIILYLLIIWFIPIYSIKINNRNNNNDIMKKNGKITPADIDLSITVDKKNIFGISIRQEKEMEFEIET